jgi:hypothetical protein
MPPSAANAARAAELTHQRLAGRAPGAFVAVTSADNTVFTTCHGYADLKWNVPVTPSTCLNSRGRYSVSVHQLLTHTGGARNVDDSPDFKQLCHLGQTWKHDFAESPSPFAAVTG